ncbi:MAG: tryptophan 7-halogenase, partial [Gammaproteobacteria bacterium]|nr:tryptophan 7-halogenase [Gammaproteobacteria bacterium]
MQPGASSLRKIAVVGRGTAGSLAAASVTRLHPDGDHELHHIYDSRIPVIGVGEGSWPSLVRELKALTGLPHETVQRRLNGTRKYGVAFEGWGRRNRDFTHYFTPQQVSYAYHLSADVMADLLHESTHARHIDAKVIGITGDEDGALVEFEGRPPERYDLVFDARGFPRKLDPGLHIDISFIPTNTAVIRRCPSVIRKEHDGPVVQHTYTRAVARPHGWIFVIPL